MDVPLFYLINRGMANPLFDILMPALSDRGYLLVLPFLIYILILSARSAGAAGSAMGRSSITRALWAVAISVCSVLLGGVLETFLKTAIARVRPCHVLEGVRLLARCYEGYSMPSGHAISSFAFATPFFYLTGRMVPLAARVYPVVLAGLIALSRVYVGVHYPSDIAVGAALGSAIAMFLCLFLEYADTRVRLLK